MERRDVNVKGGDVTGKYNNKNKGKPLIRELGLTRRTYTSYAEVWETTLVLFCIGLIS